MSDVKKTKMQKVLFWNGKGGVGKTTLATTFACGAAIKGRRVLLIDTDPQGHITKSLNMPYRDSLYELLVEDAEWKDVIRVPDIDRWAGDYAAKERLYVLPSYGKTSKIRSDTNNDEGRLMDRLLDEDTLERAGIDLVVFDCNPSVGNIITYVLMAADELVIPVTCQELSIAGTVSTMQQLNESVPWRRRIGLPDLKIIGVQPTIHRRNKVFKHNLSILRKGFDEPVWEPIHERAAWDYASKNKRSIFSYAPGSVMEEQAWRFVNNVMEAHHVEA